MNDAGWMRLSIRVVYLDALRLTLAFAIGYVGTRLDGSGAVRPLFVAAAVGVLGAVLDFRRWVTTRFRVTDERVELRTGWLVRKHRTVPRDRIRSVDSRAPLRHRLFSLRVVEIGSGEAATSFTLDALTRGAAATLQRDLMPGAAEAPADPTPAETGSARTEPAGTVIARLRWRWVALSTASLWAPFVVAGPLFGAYWALRPFGVDLLAVARRLLDRASLPPGWVVVGGLAVALLLGLAGLAAGFVLQYGNFRLTRVGTPPATTLVTTMGLLDTRTVHRDDRRIRGLAFDEPLVWRWLRLTGTHLVTTGLGTDSTPGGAILPRLAMPEARALAARILPDGRRPWEVPLRRHPRGALTRRLLGAVGLPSAAAAVLWAYGTAGTVPAGWWPAPLALLPLTVPLAVVGYRALGHALTGPYLVLRGGALNRRTVALQHRAVIGWTVRQSIFQRWGGRATVTVATAAGDRSYEVPDAGLDQALALITGATPELAARFVVASDTDAHGAADPPVGRIPHLSGQNT